MVMNRKPAVARSFAFLLVVPSMALFSYIEPVAGPGHMGGPGLDHRRRELGMIDGIGI